MRSSMLLGSVAGLAVLATALSQRSEAVVPPADLCRAASALPTLPAEQVVERPQQPLTDALPMPMPAPPPPPPPPVPPPPPTPERGGDVVGKAVRPDSPSRAIERDAAPMPAPAPMPSPPPPPPPSPEVSVSARALEMPGTGGQAPPAGLLTAGDHDDLLNPLLYARYVWRAARELGQVVASLPRVDTRRVLTVAVEDRSGRPTPFVPVTVRCANGKSLTYSTLADGTVTLFPGRDRLGSRVTISAGGKRRQVAIEADSGGQTQTLVIGAPARPVRKLDLMITLDSTGSMGDEIAYLKAELRSIVDDLSRRYGGLDIRIGLVSYRDLGDDYVTRTLPLTADFDAVQASLDRIRGYGGGDTPEAMDQALIRATGQAWRPDAAKVMLLVADAPPHDDLQARAFRAVEAARAQRVQVVPVAASGVDDRAEYFMRAAAALTQSRYIFLTDDSGIGNPHAEPDVDCYVVTPLATSIRRVLASFVSGERLEPLPQEVIRTVGRYDHGKCVLPRDFRIQ